MIGMTLVGIAFVLGMGATALDDSQQASRLGSAEHAMTQLDSQVSLVALGAADRQQISIQRPDTGARMYVDESAGWINVTIVNATTGDVKDVLVNATLGAIVYETGDAQVAYQGGGVWRKGGNGTAMISPPEYHFQATDVDPTLTLPVVLVRGDQELDGTITAERDGLVVPKYPVPGNGSRTNPFDDGVVEITIHSNYYRSWGRFMQERADGEVEYDDASDTVTSTLISTETIFEIESGVHLSNRNGKVVHFHAKEGKSGVHEYNSSEGPVATSYSGFGKLRSEGGLEIQDGRFNASTVISASGEVRLEGGGWTPGNLSYGGWLNNQSDMSFHVKGWVRDDAEVVDAPELGTHVQDKEDELRANNDNDATDDIVWDGDRWQFNESKTSWTLTAGDYFINETADWKDGDESLTIDLSGGDVELVTTEEWKLEKGATINVINPDNGTARIYFSGGDKPKFEILKGSSVTVEDDKAPSLWVYANKDEKVEFKVEDDSLFTGVFYAPGRNAKTKAEVVRDSRLYGAMVANEMKLERNGTVYYDTALEGVQPIGTDDYTSRITFLHISVNTVRVES